MKAFVALLLAIGAALVWGAVNVVPGGGGSGSGVTNAVGTLKTNGVNVGTGLTQAGFSNTPSITWGAVEVSGVASFTATAVAGTGDGALVGSNAPIVRNLNPIGDSFASDAQSNYLGAGVYFAASGFIEWGEAALIPSTESGRISTWMGTTGSMPKFFFHSGDDDVQRNILLSEDTTWAGNELLLSEVNGNDGIVQESGIKLTLSSPSAGQILGFHSSTAITNVPSTGSGANVLSNAPTIYSPTILGEMNVATLNVNTLGVTNVNTNVASSASITIYGDRAFNTYSFSNAVAANVAFTFEDVVPGAGGDIHFVSDGSARTFSFLFAGGTLGFFTNTFGLAGTNFTTVASTGGALSWKAWLAGPTTTNIQIVGRNLTQ